MVCYKWFRRQGIIISLDTGENIAVAYKLENAPLLACAPKLLEALRSRSGDNDSKRQTVRTVRGLMRPLQYHQFGRAANFAIGKSKGES